MFQVLKAVDFYDTGRIREKLRDAHGVVRRGITHHLEAGKLKRDEIVVSYLGSAGKSGARYARLYADGPPRPSKKMALISFFSRAISCRGSSASWRSTSAATPSASAASVVTRMDWAPAPCSACRRDYT